MGISCLFSIQPYIASKTSEAAQGKSRIKEMFEADIIGVRVKRMHVDPPTRLTAGGDPGRRLRRASGRRSEINPPKPSTRHTLILRMWFCS